jgi:hypothetical protein
MSLISMLFHHFFFLFLPKHVLSSQELKLVSATVSVVAEVLVYAHQLVMIPISAQLKLVLPPLVFASTTQILAMMEMNALELVALLKMVAHMHQSLVTMVMPVLMILVIQITDVSMQQQIAMTAIHVPSTLAILELDANTKMCPVIFAMWMDLEHQDVIPVWIQDVFYWIVVMPLVSKSFVTQ